MTGLTAEQVLERAVEEAEERPWSSSEVVTKVEDSGDYWMIQCDSSGFGLKKSYGVVPKVGDTARTYVHLGSSVHGIDINGVPVFFQTKAEIAVAHALWVENMHRERREEFEKAKPQLDADYDSLPQVFKDRIDRFRSANSDFRWEYEPYEMFTCTEAVKMAEAARKHVDDHTNDDEVNSFYADPKLLRLAAYGSDKEAVEEPENPYTRWLVWVDAVHSKAYDYDGKRQKRLTGLSDGHSGNTYGCAMYLARVYIEGPGFVAIQHGALTPLVGCADYGCAHSEEVAV